MQCFKVRDGHKISMPSDFDRPSLIWNLPRVEVTSWHERGVHHAFSRVAFLPIFLHFCLLPRPVVLNLLFSDTQFPLVSSGMLVTLFSEWKTCPCGTYHSPCRNTTRGSF